MTEARRLDVLSEMLENLCRISEQKVGKYY